LNVESVDAYNHPFLKPVHDWDCLLLTGDMVLYESHSVLHGRPFPLKGRFYANIFVHFEPVGHSLRHHNHETDAGEDVDEKYRDALSRRAAGHETQADGLPPYIIAGTPEESNWRRSHPSGYKAKQKSFTTGSTVAHQAAQKGDLTTLAKEVSKRKELIHAKDKNGWQPVSSQTCSMSVSWSRCLVLSLDGAH
jgi:prolyl 4-hydroxylase